jgi:hypothetical protein
MTASERARHSLSLRKWEEEEEEGIGIEPIQAEIG